MYIAPKVPLGRASSNKIIIKAKKEKEEERVKKDYVSDEIKQCPKKPKLVDERILEVMKSCKDLEIDG